MRITFVILLLCVSFLGIGLFQSASAQTLLVAPTGPESGAELVAVIRNVTDWLFFGFLLLAAVFIIIAAFQFLSGGGDPAQVSSAKRKLIIAVVAIIIATLSKGFVTVATSILGVT